MPDRTDLSCESSMKGWSQWQPGTRSAVGVVGIWLMILVLHTALMYRQMASSKKPMALLNLAGMFFNDYFFLLVFSALLALAFARWQQQMLRPRTLLGLGTLFVLVVPFLMHTSAVLLTIWLDQQPLSAFGKVLAARNKFSWWLEICMALAGFAMQAAHAAWVSSARQQAQWQQEEIEHLELRLRLLQGQLKPHFLFNALNSISALVRTAERDLASAAMRKLHDLLHYVVHASEERWLPVAAEMAFLEDYMALQRLRNGERLGVVFNIDDQPWERLACPPLLFQPLLENAIQHALEVQRGPCEVQIRLRLENGIIIFEVRNPLFPNSRPSKGHGVGLASIRTRLATLFAQNASLETGPDAAGGHFVACLRYPAVSMSTSMSTVMPGAAPTLTSTPTPTPGPATSPFLGA
jgi:two-component system, LytTR family, sensor histidine kinase AlgZ